jgi:hypothetical protein
MEHLKTDSFSFEVPSAGEYFAEDDRLVWRDERHELIITVRSAVGELLAAVESNARRTIERMLMTDNLTIVGRVADDATGGIVSWFVTATSPDRSFLFTQGVFRGPAAIMFATLESSTYGPDHIQVWETFRRSVRDTPPN